MNCIFRGGVVQYRGVCLYGWRRTAIIWKEDGDKKRKELVAMSGTGRKRDCEPDYGKIILNRAKSALLLECYTHSTFPLDAFFFRKTFTI